MRGFSALLVDRADLGEGTTGRYHGLLHSGGRYVVKDPVCLRYYRFNMRWVMITAACIALWRSAPSASF